MAADLYIHVLTDKFTEEDFRVFFAPADGSKWSPMTEFWRRRDAGLIADGLEFSSEWNKMLDEVEELEGKSGDKWKTAYDKFGTESPHVWIGEVSWLKAGMTGDPDAYIPDTVGRISDLIGEDWPVLDDELFQNILDAFDLENDTACRLNDVEEVRQFLEQHKGAKLFTISW